MPYRYFQILLQTAVIAIVSVPIVDAQSPQSFDDDIIRLRRDLAQTQLDCRRTVEEMDKDRKDFESYEKRTAERIAQARRQLDTLASETKTQSIVNDSLASRIAALQQEKRQFELMADEFRRGLIALCNKVVPETKRLPPLVMTPAHSALSLLISDLNASSIDNNEGFSRLTQILSQMEEHTAGIQISQETSPAADIRGTAYRLRIGTLFEAVVDTKGERCALFDGYNSDGSPRWTSVDGVATARAILDAVAIREGKKLPAFVGITLNSSREPDSTGGAR